jgi:hypothetical protein
MRTELVNTSFYHRFIGSSANIKLSSVCLLSLHSALSICKVNFNNDSMFLIAPSVHIKTPKSHLQSE